MTDLNAMVQFARVVELGGFSKAARALGVQTSLLSRAVAQLESDLGVRLLNRTTRRMSVTDIGQTFYLHCAALAAEADAARDAVEQTRAAPRGLVRISCPIPLLEAGVAAVIARYLQDYPEVRLQLAATGRRVNLVEEGFDIALRVRTLPLEDSGEAIRPLARNATLLVGSRELLAARTTPTHPDQLEGWPTVDMSATTERHTWPLTDPDGNTVVVGHRPRLVTDDFGTLRLAVLNGTGIARLPRYVVHEDLAAGRMQELLPDWSTGPGLVHAAFPSRRGLVPAVRLLLDALSAAFGNQRIES